MNFLKENEVNESMQCKDENKLMNAQNFLTQKVLKIQIKQAHIFLMPLIIILTDKFLKNLKTIFSEQI
jgi:hypothetical protein